MAAALAIGDIIEVTFLQRFGAQTGAMVYHLRVDNIANGAVEDQDVANSMSSLFAPLIKACMGSTAEYVKTRAQVISPVRRPAVQSTLQAGAGSILGDMLPPQCAGLIKLAGEIANRHGRGRKYVPFPAESESAAGGVPSAFYITALDALKDELIDDHQVAAGGVGPGIADLDPIIWNRSLGSYQNVTGGASVQAWATQRRRSFVNRADPLL